MFRITAVCDNCSKERGTMASTTKGATKEIGDRWTLTKFAGYDYLLCDDCSLVLGFLTPCPGEAHDNPHIDHCMVCAPLWGVVRPQQPLVTITREDLARAYREVTTNRRRHTAVLVEGE